MKTIDTKNSFESRNTLKKTSDNSNYLFQTLLELVYTENKKLSPKIKK